MSSNYQYGWVPFVGEDLYQMASAGLPVDHFFRVPCKYTHVQGKIEYNF